MFIPLDNIDVKQLEKSTLIIPSVSVGNVGQLACDLIINTLRMKKVGYFCPKCFLPVVGHNPFFTSNADKNVLSLNNEVFYSAEHNVTVMQFRSSLIKKKQDEFFNSLWKMIESYQFSQMVVLTSCHAYERSDEQLGRPTLRYITSPKSQPLHQDFTSLEWKKLEEREIGYGDKELFLPGCGFAKDLYVEGCSKDLPVVLLMIFCSEGDNIPEASMLVNYLNQWKKLTDTSKKNGGWKAPNSWVNLFGNAPPPNIY